MRHGASNFSAHYSFPFLSVRWFSLHSSFFSGWEFGDGGDNGWCQDLAKEDMVRDWLVEFVMGLGLDNKWYLVKEKKKKNNNGLGYRGNRGLKRSMGLD